ncbi:MAG: hypothetical protein ACP5O3_01815 [Candidatus Micrarchaeia archaeon]
MAFPARQQLIVFSCLSFLAAASVFSDAAGLACGALFLFLVPGYFVARALRLQLNGVELAVVSVVASVLLSTQLAYWLSLAFGYSRGTLALSFFSWSLLAFCVDFKKLYPSSEVKRVLSEHKHAIAGAAATFAVVFAVLSQTLWVETANGVVVGGYNWADFFVHLSIGQSVNAGNFPPQTPFFAGAPLAYHWFVDFHTAILSKLSSVFFAFVARFENAFYSALLFLSTFCLARFLAADSKQKNSVALLAAVLMVFGGGMGFIQLAGDVGSAPLNQLIAQKNYDAHSQQFQVISVMEYLLVQRPQIIALPALAVFLLLALQGFGENSKRKVFLAGLLLGALAPFQYAAFAAGAVAAVLLAAFKAAPRNAFRERASLPALFAPLLFVLPFFFSAAPSARPKLSLGWVSGASDPFSFTAFYALNLGVPFLLAVAAAFLVGERELREKKFLVALLAALFAVPNIASFSAFEWDMGKFFACMWLPASILAAALLARAAKWLRALLVAASVLSPLLFIAWFAQSSWVALSPQEKEVADWMAANLPERAVVVSFQTQNSPIDAAGRLRLSTAEWIVFSYSLPYKERFDDIKKFYCSSADEAVKVMKKYGASFAFLGKDERLNFAGCAFNFAFDSRFKKVYDAGGIQVFRLGE